MAILDLLGRAFRPVIRNRGEMMGYIARVTAACIVAAVAVDVANQLLFAVSIGEALRSWAITAALAGVIAVVAATAAGQAHLEVYKAKIEMERLSRTDALTGLLNRRAFFEIAEAADDATVVLILADVDRFKRVNDTRGHLAGDEVLHALGETMQREMGALGHIGRVGGEEFAVLIRDMPAETVLAKLTAFRASMAARAVVLSGGDVSITISAGVAFGGKTTGFRTLYAEADEALYSAKTSGRNRIALAPSFEKALAEGTTADVVRWREDNAAETFPAEPVATGRPARIA